MLGLALTRLLEVMGVSAARSRVRSGNGAEIHRTSPSVLHAFLFRADPKWWMARDHSEIHVAGLLVITGAFNKWQNNCQTMVSGKGRFMDASISESITELVKKSDHRALAVWAADCAERVLPYFEDRYPEDDRPRRAIEALREWVLTGIFKMADVRKASLAAHAAAREVGADSPARFAARAAGQAMATAHVPTHSIAAATYAAKAIWATDTLNAADNKAKEREWQYQHLIELGNTLRKSKR